MSIVFSINSSLLSELYWVLAGRSVNSKKNEVDKDKAPAERPVNLSCKHFVGQFVYSFGWTIINFWPILILMTKRESLTKSLAPMGTASFFIFFWCFAWFGKQNVKKNKKDIVDSGIRLLINCLVLILSIKVKGNKSEFLMN